MTTTKVTSPLIDSVSSTLITGTITSSQIANQTDPAWLTLTARVPTGSILMWPTATAPSNWLLCNGSAISRTTFASLFALLGTTFGAGNGSTTFNLPNYNDRMPIGAGSLYAAAGTGGSKDASVISHTHNASSSVSDPGHSHTTPFNRTSKSNNATPHMLTDPNVGENFNGRVNLPTTSVGTGISVSTSIEATGSSGTNANLPPYLGIFFIIKT
jgi:microcystin-dependent protein